MAKLYKREKYLSKIRNFYHATDLIKVLTGLRRCGKSSIMELISKELIQSDIKKENIIFINLEKRGFKRIKTSDALENKIDELSKNKSGIKYLFIDEIQKVKGFEEVINSFRVEDEFSIFITGSNSYLLSGELSTYLTGRYVEFEIQTLTFDEYLEMKKYFKLTIESENKEFYKFIREGGFPRAVLLDDPLAKQTYIREIINDIYFKDIRRNAKIKNRELFISIQTYIINNFGAKTSISSLCNYLCKTRKEPIKKDTIYRYLSILENAKIISKCKRFDIKSKRSINGEEKYYLGDLSFYFATNTDNKINYGSVLENLVYNYARSKSYSLSIGQFRDFEVDFILRDNFNIFSYVQVSKTIFSENIENGIDKTQEREYRPLEIITDNYKKYILTEDNFILQRNGIIHENIIEFFIKNKSF